MRSSGRFIAPVVAALGVCGIALAAPAAAEPSGNLPNCQSSPGGTYTGTGLTQCQSPGNVQISASAPADPVYPYPWDDEFYGAPLIIAPGGGFGPHGGGGGGGGHGGR